MKKVLAAIIAMSVLSVIAIQMAAAEMPIVFKKGQNQGITSKEIDYWRHQGWKFASESKNEGFPLWGIQTRIRVDMGTSADYGVRYAPYVEYLINHRDSINAFIYGANEGWPELKLGFIQYAYGRNKYGKFIKTWFWIEKRPDYGSELKKP